MFLLTPPDGQRLSSSVTKYCMLIDEGFPVSSPSPHVWTVNAVEYEQTCWVDTSERTNWMFMRCCLSLSASECTRCANSVCICGRFALAASVPHRTSCFGTCRLSYNTRGAGDAKNKNKKSFNSLPLLSALDVLPLVGQRQLCNHASFMKCSDLASSQTLNITADIHKPTLLWWHTVSISFYEIVRLCGT